LIWPELARRERGDRAIWPEPARSGPCDRCRGTNRAKGGETPGKEHNFTRRYKERTRVSGMTSVTNVERLV
jgi:hypothetical protein